MARAASTVPASTNGRSSLWLFVAAGMLLATAASLAWVSRSTPTALPAAVAAVASATATPSPAGKATAATKAAATPTAKSSASIKPYDVQLQIQQTLPHDGGAFTQGLFYHEGMLYESTGIYGKSSLRQVDWPTGKVRKRWSMNARLFGEGCVWWKGDIIVLTWQARKLFVLDGASFTVKRSATFSTTTGQGWGITHNGSHLIVSDGSANLHFWDPDTLKEVGKVTVKDAQGVPQSDLNELEFAGGEILANTWFHNTRFRNQLLRIHPTTGRILGSIDCAPVLAAEGRPQNPTNDVLNGIAVQWEGPGLPTGPDPSKPLHGLSLFITGKLWNHVYKVSLSAT